jgi:hypothetical protein
MATEVPKVTARFRQNGRFGYSRCTPPASDRLDHAEYDEANPEVYDHAQINLEW